MGDLCRPVVPPALIADIAGGAYPAVLNILLFCDLIGLEPELRNDEKNSAATKARVAAIIATETADTWRSRFAGKDCCCSIVAGVGDAFADPHYVARGVFQHALTNPEGATMPALPVPLDPGFRVAPEAAIAFACSGRRQQEVLGLNTVGYASSCPFPLRVQTETTPRRRHSKFLILSENSIRPGFAS
jgi:CoA-transferase family III